MPARSESEQYIPPVHYKPSWDERVPAVTAASSPLGEQLVRQLAESTQVIAFARRQQDLDRLGQIPNVTARRVDLLHIDELYEGLKGADVVFNVAGSTELGNWEETTKSNVEAVENLIEAGQARKIGRIVQYSTIGVYDTRNAARPVTEDTPRSFDEAYGATKNIGEIILYQSGIPSTMVQPVDVIGPSVLGWTHEILNGLNGIDISSKEFKYYDNEITKFLREKFGLKRIAVPPLLTDLVLTEAIFPYIDGRNLSDLAILASQNPVAVGQGYIAVDGHATGAEILDMYADEVLGKRVYSFNKELTHGVTSGLSGALNVAGSALHNERLKTMANLLQNGQGTFSGQKARDELGFKPRVSLKQSVTDTARYVDTNGIVKSKRFTRQIPPSAPSQ